MKCIHSSALTVPLPDEFINRNCVMLYILQAQKRTCTRPLHPLEPGETGRTSAGFDAGRFYAYPLGSCPDRSVLARKYIRSKSASDNFPSLSPSASQMSSSTSFAAL